MCDLSRSNPEVLMRFAEKAKEHSYAPYSNYHVGACLIADNGKFYSGANIENGSYGASICAERVAIYKAIYDGAKQIKAIAIKADTPRAFPCGICRQVMSEFAKSEDLKIFVEGNKGDIEEYDLGILFPHAFELKKMEK